MNSLDHFLSWLYTRRMYGTWCPDYCEGCHCCEAWKFHDELFSQVPSSSASRIP